jgi:hypothetical protein
VQVQGSHQPACLLRLAGVRGVAVERYPDRPPALPTPDPAQVLADELRSFAGEEGPARAAVVSFLEAEQVKAATGLLLAIQDQAYLPGVAPPPLRLDRDRLDVEEDEDPTARPLLPLTAEAVENGRPLRVISKQLAADAPQVESPFFSTHRRCSRLMAGTRCCRRR